MNRIYQKNEVNFALICIAIYVIGTSVCEAISQSTGVKGLFSMLFHICFSCVLLIWLKKNALFQKYGLALPKYRILKAWFFIPLFLIGLSGVFFGVTWKYSVFETICYIISMLCVGFLEEIIFRGFLFMGMAKKNVTSAIVVSSVTFGIGHIVNLLNGQDLLETCLQILFAVAVGFALVTLFYKGKSLLPCIIFHGINNACSAISDDAASSRFFGGEEKALFISVILSVILCAAYSFAMWRGLGEKEDAGRI